MKIGGVGTVCQRCVELTVRYVELVANLDDDLDILAGMFVRTDFDEKIGIWEILLV